ncbi:MAG: exodeoxyribonuclease VII large subunit [Cyanobacteria bacterium]|nr:exodeoxyribonuclease VII large subunit [Cyanobacteriota bacterium]
MAEANGLPRYSVAELNQAIGTLLERGFAPRFLIDATISRPQLKKGHLWLTLVDGEASISAVIWASQLAKLSHQPSEGDGVVVVGKLNFWAARATLSVQVLDLRPSLSTVLRQFERTRQTLEPEGLFAPERKRPLPAFPVAIALLTSVPSSALADMLRTAAERWPSTRLYQVAIPVQGRVEAEICRILTEVMGRADMLAIEAIVLARGGGSREDLAVFDGEDLARLLAASPVPVVSGLGHEDDTTIADLVADYRAATPTAAIVALLPDRLSMLQRLQQSRSQLRQALSFNMQAKRQQLAGLRAQLEQIRPSRLLALQRQGLQQRRQLLEALSPQRLLQRGFAMVRSPAGQLLRSIKQIGCGDPFLVELADGRLRAQVTDVTPAQIEPQP